MQAIRFILDNNLVELEDSDPCRTLLQYLREEIGRVGSKEGCAEGDCGACTVVIAEAVDERLRFRAVNACILFLPTLDGKMLFTVESLKSAQGELHPVQQSLVDYHGSQCGFCTPGFIMSLFALYKSPKGIDRAAIDDALSGNLCRCTGYRPIIEAGLHMHDYPLPSGDASALLHPASTEPDPEERGILKRLSQLRRKQGLQLGYGARSYLAPASRDELAEYYYANPDAVILAGGTDVGLWVTKQLREIPDLIYIGNIEELNRIERRPTEIVIGAAVTLSDAFDSLSNDFPELSELFRRFASLPVRNAGTLVGNMANASPIGDSMPALICLDARLTLRRGPETRDLALQDFYLDYQKTALRAGEYIDSVSIPRPEAGLILRCYKLSKRFDQDISAVCAAFLIHLDADKITHVRIAFGGMAAIPKRAIQAERALQGQAWDEAGVRASMQALAQDFQPLSDMRSSAAYRQQCAANLLYRFYLETRQQNALLPAMVNVFAVQS